MLPKDGDLSSVSNWRPIAILPVIYKLFARFLYNRISPQLFRAQSRDQHAFTPQVPIEDALFCTELSIEYALEFQTSLRLLSMDLRKAFDTIDHDALFASLQLHGIDDGYVSLS